MEYWPFLTGRVRHTGHRVIVAPELLTGEQATTLLGRLPAPGGGFPSDEDEILRRVVHRSAVGPITIFYRVIEATAEGYGVSGDGALHDQYGRPILLTEGIVVSGARSDVAEVDIRTALQEAHSLVTPAFRDFWQQESAYRKIFLPAQNLASPAADQRSAPPIFDISDDRPTAPSAPSWRSSSGFPRRPLTVLVIVLLGLVSGVVGWRWWPQECGTSAPAGIRLNSETDGECIGVTEGDYLFNDPSKAANHDDRLIMQKINNLQKRIAEENRTAAESGRYVKIILLMPLTVSKSGPATISLTQILHSLQGSYTALRRSSQSNEFGDKSAVKIQLLLANQGSRQESDSEFLDSILAESEADHPVDAVVGLGSSIPNTEKAVDYLGERGIPMVSAVASADNLTNKPLLWSVSPGNDQYAARLRTYLDHEQSVLRSGVIVYDRNPDLYTQSLRSAYKKHLESYLKFANDQAFLGSTLGRPDITPGVFSPLVANVCNAATDPKNPLDMVLYAGRTADFSAFSEALAARICVPKPLTVLFGATGFAPTRDLQLTLKRGNIRVIAATSSNPSAWVRNGLGAPPGFTAFLAAYRDSGFVDADLSDSYAIAHHDALVSAVQAIRLADENKTTPVPDPGNVAAHFPVLSLNHVVPAASGNLSFGTESGRAEGLSVPIHPFTP